VLHSIFTKYSKYIKFIIVGGINAAIYFVMLMACIALTEDYYLSVGLSQVGIAVIAYINFSRFHYKSQLEFKIFIKFAISNVLLFLASSGIVWATSGMQLYPAVFGVINVVMIAPLSYIFNTYFVFNNAQLARK